MTDWPFANFGVCEICDQIITGSHYHCGGCDSSDVTGSYGHHSSICRYAEGGTLRERKREFHHCGPNGDCELASK